MEQTVGMAEAKSRLAELVGHVKYGGETFILQRRGEPMAVLVSVAEFKRLQAAAGQSDAESQSPLTPALLHRQQALVAQARRLRESLGQPAERLAAFFADLPPADDAFWLEIEEAG
ncbi:MAG: type II toxin-antitoxin system prevent-host-death family antitoxin [Caldilineaceae bacterium]|nr:type II toxin-antitoxin system prevent-host-death family antitoxin [Caldilineaceae bacterium]